MDVYQQLKFKNLPVLCNSSAPIILTNYLTYTERAGATPMSLAAYFSQLMGRNGGAFYLYTKYPFQNSISTNDRRTYTFNPNGLPPGKYKLFLLYVSTISECPFYDSTSTITISPTCP